MNDRLGSYGWPLFCHFDREAYGMSKAPVWGSKAEVSVESLCPPATKHCAVVPTEGIANLNAGAYFRGKLFAVKGSELVMGIISVAWNKSRTRSLSISTER